MATKKKTKKKSPRSKKLTRVSTPPKKLARKRTITKKSVKKAAGPNIAVQKRKGLKQATGGKTARMGNNKTQNKSEERGSSAFSRETSGSRSGEQSGDLQGLSNVESADSESVDELLEEGNAFEAEVVSGVERASARDEREVRTHEVPEDDVPEEYLDKE